MALIPRIQWLQLIMINEAVINSFNFMMTCFLRVFDRDLCRLSFLDLYFFPLIGCVFLYDVVSYIKI